MSTPNQTEPAPCPFCSCKATTVVASEHELMFVLCGACMAEGPAIESGIEAEAVAAWNRRAPVSPAQEKLPQDLHVVAPFAPPASQLCFDDAEIERAALKHVATRFGKLSNESGYRATAQFALLKAFANELASGFREGRNAQPDSQDLPASSQSLAPAAPDLLPPMGIRNDRDMLNYLNGAFESEVGYCSKCGNGDDTKDCDSASFLREYLAAAPSAAPEIAPVGQAVPEHWRGRAEWIANGTNLGADERGRLAVMLLRTLLVSPVQQDSAQSNNKEGK